MLKNDKKIGGHECKVEYRTMQLNNKLETMVYLIIKTLHC